MSASQQPDTTGKDCATCSGFGRWMLSSKTINPDYGGSVWCARHEQVRLSEMGCASWERETGSDDEVFDYKARRNATSETTW
jgi:hypothetical protein